MYSKVLAGLGLKESRTVFLVEKPQFGPLVTEQWAIEISDFLEKLSKHPTRILLASMLYGQGSLSVGELADRFTVGRATISHHLDEMGGYLLHRKRRNRHGYVNYWTQDKVPAALHKIIDIIFGTQYAKIDLAAVLLPSAKESQDPLLSATGRSKCNLTSGQAELFQTYLQALANTFRILIISIIVNNQNAVEAKELPVFKIEAQFEGIGKDFLSAQLRILREVQLVSYTKDMNTAQNHYNTEADAAAILHKIIDTIFQAQGAGL